jgi:hypothetical protein
MFCHRYIRNWSYYSCTPQATSDAVYMKLIKDFHWNRMDVDPISSLIKINKYSFHHIPDPVQYLKQKYIGKTYYYSGMHNSSSTEFWAQSGSIYNHLNFSITTTFFSRDNVTIPAQAAILSRTLLKPSLAPNFDTIVSFGSMFRYFTAPGKEQGQSPITPGDILVGTRKFAIIFGFAKIIDKNYYYSIFPNLPALSNFWAAIVLHIGPGYANAYLVSHNKYILLPSPFRLPSSASPIYYNTYLFMSIYLKGEDVLPFDISRSSVSRGIRNCKITTKIGTFLPYKDDEAVTYSDIVPPTNDNYYHGLQLFCFDENIPPEPMAASPYDMNPPLLYYIPGQYIYDMFLSYGRVIEPEQIPSNDNKRILVGMNNDIIYK